MVSVSLKEKLLTAHREEESIIAWSVKLGRDAKKGRYEALKKT